MTAAFFLGQDVNLAGELGVRMDRTGLGQDLASFDGLLVNAAEQSADVVASLKMCIRDSTKTDAMHASRSVMTITPRPLFLSVESLKNSPTLNAINASAI